VREEIKTAVCPRPIRTREDDKIVEIFLHAYQDGRFAHKLEWQPQHETNVEVIGAAKDGTRLAVEHTRLFEFPIGRLGGNPEEDPVLGEVEANLARGEAVVGNLPERTELGGKECDS
jgi:hypothetical protein